MRRKKQSAFVFACPLMGIGVGLVALLMSGTAYASPVSTSPVLPCGDLAQLAEPNVQITTAETVSGGSFTPAGTTTPITGLPNFCRVVGSLHPTSDSDIGFEVWLPMSGWNGRYEQVGNGGNAGSIEYGDLGLGIQRGFTSASTDDGHTGTAGDVSWAPGHPEKIIDFGYRAVHGTADIAKELVRIFYGDGPAFSYFVGCSEGGREALIEAQRYPTDFNGIVAGDPAQWLTHLWAEHIWNQQAMLLDPARTIPATKAPAIQAAALAACDKPGDNIADGIAGDPRACHFDPSTLLCRGPETDSCLTAPQIEGLELMYAGAHDPVTGQRQFAGFQPGSESDPNVFSMQSAVLSGPNSIDFSLGAPDYGAYILGNPNFNGLTFNFATDVATADNTLIAGNTAASILDASDPTRLQPFLARGGKLIQFHGWADYGIAPFSVNYYEAALAAQDPFNRAHAVRLTQKNFRLFMVPGMHHCSGGPGANSFGQSASTLASVADPQHDVVLAMQQWVEAGVAPDRIIATKFVNDTPAQGTAFTRPLCPYPLTARYGAAGDPTSAASFTCVDEHLDAQTNLGITEVPLKIHP